MLDHMLESARIDLSIGDNFERVVKHVKFDLAMITRRLFTTLVAIGGEAWAAETFVLTLHEYQKLNPVTPPGPGGRPSPSSPTEPPK